MPGYKNVGGPRFLGAGGPKKKGFIGYQKRISKYPGRGSVKLPDKKPMPHYPGKDRDAGSRMRPGVHAPGRPSYEQTKSKILLF